MGECCNLRQGYTKRYGTAGRQWAEQGSAAGRARASSGPGPRRRVISCDARGCARARTRGGGGAARRAGRRVPEVERLQRHEGMRIGRNEDRGIGG
jgi:hypothetical protein